MHPPDHPSGLLGKVRARLELGQARRQGVTVLGRRAIALGSHRILRRVAIVLNIHVGRGQVAGAGQARSLGVTARTRLGRARKSATNLLGLEAAIRRGHGGEVEQDRRNIRLSAQVQSGHIGKVRVRLEHAQARRLSGAILGRRANALSVSSLAKSGTNHVNIIANLVSVGLLLGNSANWGTSARFGRARETTADLLRPKTVDTVAVEGGAEEVRGTTSMGFNINLNARRGVHDGSDSGHRPIVVSDIAAASGGTG